MYSVQPLQPPGKGGQRSTGSYKNSVLKTIYNTLRYISIDDVLSLFVSVVPSCCQGILNCVHLSNASKLGKK